LINAVFPSTYNEYAGFADLTWHLTEALDLAVGGRYSTISQNIEVIETGAVVGPVPLTTSGSTTNHVDTWSVNPSYHLTKDTLLYARIATGFQPGGANIVFPGQNFPATFGPDTTTNYEIGVKSALFDHRVQIDFDGFDVEWKNIQLLQTFTDAAGSEFQGYGNGGMPEAPASNSRSARIRYGIFQWLSTVPTPTRF
jgi:outer membrane receptor protein involved in Fe transport